MLCGGIPQPPRAARPQDRRPLAAPRLPPRTRVAVPRQDFRRRARTRAARCLETLPLAGGPALPVHAPLPHAWARRGRIGRRGRSERTAPRPGRLDRVPEASERRLALRIGLQLLAVCGRSCVRPLERRGDRSQRGGRRRVARRRVALPPRRVPGVPAARCCGSPLVASRVGALPGSSLRAACAVATALLTDLAALIVGNR